MNIPNYPTINNGYEYTDDDFAAATQPYWIGIKLEQEKSEEIIRKKKIEAWYEKYGELENEAIEEARKAEEEIRRNNHDAAIADYYDEMSREDLTPDGWPETFYEY